MIPAAESMRKGSIVKSEVNSLECGGPAPLWPDVAQRLFRSQANRRVLVSAQGREIEKRAKAAPGRRTPRSCRQLALPPYCTSFSDAQLFALRRAGPSSEVA